MLYHDNLLAISEAHLAILINKFAFYFTD